MSPITTSELALIATGAIVGTLLTEIVRRLLTRFWVSTIDPQIDRMSRARRERRQQSEVLAEIAQQLIATSGESLIDRIRNIERDVAAEDATHDRIETALAEVMQKQDWVLGTLNEQFGKSPEE